MQRSIIIFIPRESGRGLCRRDEDRTFGAAGRTAAWRCATSARARRGVSAYDHQQDVRACCHARSPDRNCWNRKRPLRVFLIMIVDLPWPCENALYEAIMKRTNSSSLRRWPGHDVWRSLLQDIATIVKESFDGRRTNAGLSSVGIPTDRLARDM